MDDLFTLILNIIWLTAAAANFLIQMLYFFNDKSPGLFRGKKITTPLLLFLGLLIVILKSKGFPLVPAAILLAMGVGELGIEGSSVVENRELAPADRKTTGTELRVLLAGILFLLVNLFIGGILLLQGLEIQLLLGSVFLGFIVIALLLHLSLRFFKPPTGIRTQMLLYGIGLAVLAAGALADIFNGISPLGQAALVLTISDSLVLIRMGAGLEKHTKTGFRILLAFLITILLLYYVYMRLLIQIVQGA